MPGTTANFGWRYPLPGELATADATARLAYDMDATYTSIDTLRTQALHRSTASISSTSTQSVTKSTLTKLTFTTTNWDTDTMSNLGTNNDRLTVKTAGLYYVTAVARYSGFSGGIPPSSGSFCSVAISRNGTTTPVNADYAIRLRAMNGAITDYSTWTCHLMAVSDFWQVWTQWGGASQPAGPLNVSAVQLIAQLIARNP